jgi:hypothetical protein
MSILYPDFAWTPTQSQSHAIPDISVPEEESFVTQLEPDDPLTLHQPISQCPDDIIQTIFEHLADTSGYPSPADSVRLSSVCRRWRVLALNTPRLWRHVFLDLSAPLDRQDFIRTEIIPRSKHVPITVIVDALNATTIPTMGLCGLKSIPEISELALKLTTPSDAPLLLGSNFTPPVGAMQSLRIESNARMNYFQSHTPPKIDMLSLFERFPPFNKLVIKRLPYLILPMAATNQNQSITEIDFYDVGLVDIARLLTMLPRVKSVTIRKAILVVQGSYDSDVPFHNIKDIVLHHTLGESWMTKVTFPQLDELEYTEVTESFLNFVSAHRSIRVLRSLFCGDMITALAMLAPQLEQLLITSPVANIYSPLGHDSEMPFPKLKSLHVITSRPCRDLTLTEFEALVRARFLPLQHPKSLSKHSSHIILFLIIQKLKCVTPRWYRSKLYEESSHMIVITDEETEIIRLGWCD